MTTVIVPFLSETNIAPVTLGLENEFSFWEGLPVGAVLVSGSVVATENLKISEIRRLKTRCISENESISTAI